MFATATSVDVVWLKNIVVLRFCDLKTELQNAVLHYKSFASYSPFSCIKHFLKGHFVHVLKMQRKSEKHRTFRHVYLSW